MENKRGDFWRIMFKNEELVKKIISAEHDLKDDAILLRKWYSAILENFENESQTPYFDFLILAETVCLQVRILASEMDDISNVSAYRQPCSLSTISVGEKLASFYDIYQMTDEAQLLERIKGLECERDETVLIYNKQIEAFSSKLESI